ncbi:MAG: nicotinate-nucleotide--dimethylbenzimidazole phosphoribosyltransferase [Rhodospirillales bacterium]|nr:nicotinate-nucleotide--dimethylbenzimidazole phosphoribosyltransferase [Alphaproteobacteria bacterium]MBL6948349.1 nicotinate-nucleotide--dimethylbenzimidazole phosphoribosyltransferase [Rhodospirillales bacterium]
MPSLQSPPMSPPVIKSLDDIRAALQSLPAGDDAAAAKASGREPTLTKPPGSLGRLEELSQWLCRWQGRHPPSMGAPKAQVFAGNHGVVAQGVSAFPADVTAQMVANFEAGGAAINQLCQVFGVGFSIDALSLDRPTGDFTEGPAMTEDECVDAFVFGMGTVSDGMDVLCLGEMGIGNTTSAAALTMALFGGDAAHWTGSGTGVQGAQLEKKTAVVAKAAALHGNNAPDPLQSLCRLGGRELAAITGAVLAARFRRVPVLLDGYVATAAAAALEAARPGALEHCRAGHVSAEPGHRRLLEKLDMVPILDLDMRLGEASGAVLAVAVLKAATACHSGMATFEDAAVSGKTGE